MGLQKLNQPKIGPKMMGPNLSRGIDTSNQVNHSDQDKKNSVGIKNCKKH